MWERNVCLHPLEQNSMLPRIAYVRTYIVKEKEKKKEEGVNVSTGIEKENFESRVKSLGKNAEWCLEMLPYSLLL